MEERNKNRQGYKKTEVGWIPEEWDVLSLDSGCKIKHGYPFQGHLMTQRECDAPIVVSIGNYDYSGGFRFHSTVIRRYDGPYPSEFVLAPGSILLAMTCQTPGGEILGLPGIVPDDSNTYLHNQRLGLLDIKNKQRFNPLFLYYSFLSSKFNRFLVASATGTKVKHTSPSAILMYNLATPPLPEQKKIAEILSTWDEAIEQTRKLIDTKKSRKKALMQQLLTGKKRLPGFNEEWRSVRLRDLLKQVFRSVEFDDDATYDLISVRRRSGGIFYRGKTLGESILTKQLYTARSGDFLISKMQIVHGASALATDEFDGMHISGSYIALRVASPEKLDVNFLDWLSKTPYFYHLTYLASYGVHIEKMTFNLRLFLKSEIKIPANIEEQRRVVEILSTADDEIDTLEKKLTMLEEQKHGLMQKLLTGEVRVQT